MCVFERGKEKYRKSIMMLADDMWQSRETHSLTITLIISDCDILIKIDAIDPFTLSWVCTDRF